jgi:hypothetical protein
LYLYLFYRLHLAAARALQYLDEQLERLLQHVGRTHVDLGDHYKYGHTQGQSQPEVLLEIRPGVRKRTRIG